MSLNELLVVNDASKPWANINVHDIHAYGSLTVDGGMIITGDTTFAGNILPDSTAANRTIGSSSKIWNSAFATTANLQNIQNLSTSNFVIKNHAGTDVLHFADATSIITAAVEFDAPTIQASILLTGATVNATVQMTTPLINTNIIETKSNGVDMLMKNFGGVSGLTLANADASITANVSLTTPIINTDLIKSKTAVDLVMKNHSNTTALTVKDSNGGVTLGVELNVPYVNVANAIFLPNLPGDFGRAELNTYAQDDVTAAVGGPWAANQACTFNFTRIGRIVTMRVTAAFANATISNEIAPVPTTIIPLNYRPPADTYLPMVVEDNATWKAAIIGVFSTGTFLVYADVSQDPFAAAGLTTGFFGFTVSWSV